MPRGVPNVRKCAHCGGKLSGLVFVVELDRELARRIGKGSGRIELCSPQCTYDHGFHNAGALISSAARGGG